MKHERIYFTTIILLGLVSMACGLVLPGGATAIPALTTTPTPTTTSATTATEQPSSTPLPQTPTPDEMKPVLGSKSIQEKSAQPAYTILGEYAVLEGDPAVIDPFNQTMKNFIDKTVGGFKQDLSQVLDTSQTTGSDFEIHFNTTLVSGRIISILYTTLLSAN